MVRAGARAGSGGAFGKGQGRGGSGARSGRGDSGAPRFEAREPDQLTGFDDLTETKFGKKQAKLARLSGGQGALMLDEDELEEALNLLDMWSDDDDLQTKGPSGGGGKGKVTQAEKASLDKASKAAKDVGLDTRFMSLGAASKVDLVADFRTPRESGGGSASSAMAAAATSPGGGHDQGELPPVQKPKLELPEGVQVVGGDVTYEEQEDGSYALLVPEGAFLKVSLSATPWVLEEDGRLHNFTMVLAVRLDAMPSATVPIFSGGAPPPPGEKVENVSIFKNGGVGALNDMGTAEAAVRAERWCWLVITRKPGELNTFVNGRLCAAVKIEAPKPPEKKEEKEKEKDNEGKPKEEDAAAGPKPQLQEKFVLDPQFIALFAGGEGGVAEAAVRGLAIKYLRITSKVWRQDEISEELHKVRSADEEAELSSAADKSRASKLCLQDLYAKPPPVWLHPAFAAEFADPFIAGTAFEESEMHISIEVLTLTLDEMLKAGDLASKLSHTARSALNTACSQLKDTRKLAHKLAHARDGQGQERSFFSALAKAFDDLDPGCVMMVPYDNGDSPLLLIVRRGVHPYAFTCTFTVVNSTSRGSEFHPADGTNPPKIKYRTCLELGDVPVERLGDEAFWVVLWFGMNIDDPEAMSAGRLKRGGLETLYEVCLPFLAGTSLDRGLARWQAAAEERGIPQPPPRTLRRSNSGHYGCCRHALRYLLERSGVGADECRIISLLLRHQMFRLAQNDLRFVMGLGDAERMVLDLAKRQLAYKAAKLGSQQLIGLAQMGTISHEIAELDELIKKRGGRMDEPAPPPLILSAADAHLGRPSLEHLLGPMLLPAIEGGESHPAVVIKGIEVLGLYFSASWCSPCVQTTPLLAAAYKALRARGKMLEIVLVPQDHTEDEYHSYRATQPWPALPFGGQLPAILSQLYQVGSIPCLVLLEPSGRLISTDGVRLLRRHARAFPWGGSAPKETPHLHPLFDRLLRISPIDPGQVFDLPKYKPLDFLRQPQAATTLEEAISALRTCDMLCTQTAVQAHSVLNTNFLKVGLIQHTFTCVLPMPKPEGDKVGAVFPQQCLWRTPLLYDQQLGILLLLQRILEHFAASVLSLDHTRSLDAVRMVVPACIAAVADVVMRQIATDEPSRVCLHLRGTHEHKGFTIGSGALAKQSSHVPVHTPELNTARACVLDYFDAQSSLPQIYAWENTGALELQTVKWLRQIAQDLAFPADINNVAEYIRDIDHLVIKNYPEFRCFRDIAFYFKFFLNPQISAFPKKAAYTQRQAQLLFFYHQPEQTFFVGGFKLPGGDLELLSAKPRVKRGEEVPTTRFASLADPNEYTRPSRVEGEDDLLHMWDLPDFGELASPDQNAAAKALGQHDAELLLSYLTVPYLRIPLVISFFASEDRIHLLQAPKLQALFDAVLFEPGTFLPKHSAELEPVDVPTSAPELLGTAHHMLLNELMHSPKTLVEGVLKLAHQATDLDTGTFKASTTTVILYVVRLASRFENYVSFLIQYDAGSHDSIRGKPFRQLGVPARVREQLVAARMSLRKVLLEELRPLLSGWYHKLSRELDTALVEEDDEILDENVRHMCVVHSHLVLMLRNVTAAELCEPLVSTLVCGMAFLATRHQWNKELLDVWDGAPSYDAWRVPETELYEAMHVVRRRVVGWLRTSATQRELDAVMTAVVRISEGSGAMLAPKDEVAQRWGYLAEGSNQGRFAVHSSRSRRPRHGLIEPIPTMLKEPDDAMVFDVQVTQITLMASHPQALKQGVAEMDDVTTVFGDVAMQACLTEQTSHREVYRLVGRAHAISQWDRDMKMAVLEHWRAYYPQELFPSEKAWLPAVLEPVRQTYMMQPQPLQLFLPEEPLPEDAQLAYLVGKQPSQSGAWIEVFVYRARRMVHVYRLESHGRRHYRSLIYTSDARICLHEMQPSTEHRRAPWPQWARHEAGNPYDVPEAGPSAVITREAAVPENLSFGDETYMPSRLLFGLLPTTLLEKYTFWQDEKDHLRGYPRDPAKCHDVIFVNLGVGGHVAVHGGRFEQVRRGDSLLAPARAVVLRLLRSRLERQRKATHDALALLDTFTKEHGLLSHPFESSFAVCGGVTRLLQRLGKHSFGAGSEPAISRDLERIKELLGLVNLVPFQRRRRRHRLSKIVIPALLDALVALLDDEETKESNRAEGSEGGAVPTPASGSRAPGQEGSPAAAAGASAAVASATGASAAAVPSTPAEGVDFDDEELVLLDLLHAPPDSYLYSLATVMARVESLSHVLAWARYDEMARLHTPEAVTQSDLHLVSLPRLKLTFEAREVHGSVRLYSVDHADLFITNQRNEASSMLAGIPHSLLLSNSNDELSVLVPAWPPCRPAVDSVPFSTELVLDRSSRKWYDQLEHPYYMYPVHVSLSFLYSTTLASALYLLLLRYLNRQYKAVVRLVDTVGTDSALTKEEAEILAFTTCSKVSPDKHPDAFAARLKISLVMLDAPLKLPWDLSREMAGYLLRLEHVSADCLLAPEEELTLLKKCICDVADKRYTPENYTALGVTMCKNRRAALRARVVHARSLDGSLSGALPMTPVPSCSIELPKRAAESRSSWVYKWHPTVLHATPEVSAADRL
jgi:thiol-disulfide isomerase/thioredoxin